MFLDEEKSRKNYIIYNVGDWTVNKERKLKHFVSGLTNSNT